MNEVFLFHPSQKIQMNKVCRIRGLYFGAENISLSLSSLCIFFPLIFHVSSIIIFFLLSLFLFLFLSNIRPFLFPRLKSFPKWNYSTPPPLLTKVGSWPLLLVTASGSVLTALGLWFLLLTPPKDQVLTLCFCVTGRGVDTQVKNKHFQRGFIYI